MKPPGSAAHLYKCRRRCYKQFWFGAKEFDMRRLALVLVFGFLAVSAVPQFADAQVRGGARAGGMGGGGHVAVSAPHPAMNAGAGMRTAPRPGGTVPRGTTVFRGTPGVITASRGTAIGHPVSRANSSVDRPASLPDFTGVPGLGFDFVHLAAVHPQQRGRHNFRNGNVGFFPFFDSGFLLPYSYGYGYSDTSADDTYASNAVSAPQYSADTANDAQNAPSDNRRPSSRYGLQAATAPYDVVVTPQKQSEQYVFVRRDGTVFFAVAYSWEAGNLFYVTQDGLRRSVTSDVLDLVATQQFNEQRGLTFRAPAQS
jgi:hypothetical protein